MNRRVFLAAAVAVPLQAAATPARIIDTHTHFYNPSRPGGVPWPPKNDPLLYRTVLPAEYQKMTAKLGITGTIKVEASRLLEDNQWVLDLAAQNPIIVGTVGHLEPGQPGFRQNLDRFAKNPLFRGIRVGSLFGKNLDQHLANPQFLTDLKALGTAGLELDTIGGPPLLEGLVTLTDKLPDLRMVIDHLPFDPPEDSTARRLYQSALRELGRRPQVFAKVSNVPRKTGDKVREDLAYYRPALDELWEVFGAGRLLYGSNWPVSDKVAPFPVALNLVKAYFGEKGQEACDKYFWKNSVAAYRWKPR